MPLASGWGWLYLVARDPHKRRLLYAGCGLIAYALLLAADALDSAQLAQASRALILLPPVFWAATAYTLWNEPPFRAFDLGVWLAALILFVMGWLGDGLAIAAGIAAVLLLLIALVLAWRAARDISSRRRAGVLMTAVLFFSLTIGAMILRFSGLPRDILLLILGFDLPFLGIAIAALDAFDEGETLLPDALRSLVISALAAFLFGGLVALGIMAQGAITLPLVGLLFAVIAAAIGLQVFAGVVQGWTDRLVLRQPVAAARAELRAAADALPRIDPAFDPLALSEAEFTRLTRRALSHMSDLPHLAASPLTQLPIIETRLAARSGPIDRLARAAELKALLSECILRLKPDGKGDFGTTGEWRHYNALYFPYVAGLRPYGYHDSDLLSEADAAVLAWFRSDVPERTLHNWQNAAAKLIAEQLLDRNRHSKL